MLVCLFTKFEIKEREKTYEYLCDFLAGNSKIIKLQNYKKINIKKKICSTFKGFCLLEFYFVSNLASRVMPILGPILAREGFPERSNSPSIDF